MRLPYLTVRTRSADQTRRLGEALGAMAQPGDVLLLVGELGTGKTTFVQGFARGLGVHETPTSPSYTLMHEYRGRLPLLHADLYRLDRAQEIVDLGLDEMLEPPWVALIEWGEKAGPVAGSDYLEIEMAAEADVDCRSVTLRPIGVWVHRMREIERTVGAMAREAS